MLFCKRVCWNVEVVVKIDYNLKSLSSNLCYNCVVKIIAHMSLTAQPASALEPPNSTITFPIIQRRSNQRMKFKLNKQKMEL